ncbi:cell wall hydrolase [Roseivivax sp. CAU 1761]
MFRVLVSAAAAIVAASSAQANGGAERNNLGTLLAQETRVLASASASHLQRLVTPETTGVATDIRYDTSWLSRQPAAKEGGAEWTCLTEALYFEARGEGLKGQLAVAEVILNRVDSPRYPDTVCGVVNQGCQFSYTCDGIPETMREKRAARQVGKVAGIMLNGAPRDLTDGATHYHTTAVNPRWASAFPMTTQIGVHRFYRQPLQISMN